MNERWERGRCSNKLLVMGAKRTKASSSDKRWPGPAFRKECAPNWKPLVYKCHDEFGHPRGRGKARRELNWPDSSPSREVKVGNN